jgi:hypothetical protein
LSCLLLRVCNLLQFLLQMSIILIVLV